MPNTAVSLLLSWEIRVIIHPQLRCPFESWPCLPFLPPPTPHPHAHPSRTHLNLSESLREIHKIKHQICQRWVKPCQRDTMGEEMSQKVIEVKQLRWSLDKIVRFPFHTLIPPWSPHPTLSFPQPQLTLSPPQVPRALPDPSIHFISLP